MGRIVLTLAIMAAAMWALAQPASGVTYAQTERAVALGPVKDNTLYEQPRGILSNGAGQPMSDRLSDWRPPAMAAKGTSEVDS